MSETKIYSVCPQCGSFIIINSADDDEIHHWSDGSTHKQFFCDSEVRIIKCGFCYNTFWREDTQIVDNTPPNARVIKNFNNDNLGDNLPFKEFVNQMVYNIKFYRDLLNQGFGNTFERDLYLNVKIIQSVNDLRRPFSGEKKRNSLSILHGGFSFKRLGNIITMEEKYERHRPLKYRCLQHVKNIINGMGFLFEVECERETHNFKRALTLLENNNFYEPENIDDLQYGTQSILYGVENCNIMKEKIKKKCRIRASRIFEI